MKTQARGRGRGVWGCCRVLCCDARCAMCAGHGTVAVRLWVLFLRELRVLYEVLRSSSALVVSSFDLSGCSCKL